MSKEEQGSSVLETGDRMKIFSNFDTSLAKRLHEEAVQKYGVENVIFVRRDPIYVYLKVYLPVIVRLVFTLIIGFFVSTNVDIQESLWTAIAWFIALVLLLLLIYVIRVAITKYIDYQMDYMIITPRQVIAYDQEGIFDRFTKSLDLSKIKSIHERKKWIMCSLFNYWSLLFFSEWDDQTGDITMNYISSPIAMKDKISKLIDENYKYHLHEMGQMVQREKKPLKDWKVNGESIIL